MYKIIKNGNQIGLAASPVYVKLLDNGYYGLCGAGDATAIVHNGTVYPLGGEGDVLLIETDAGTVMAAQESVQSILFVTAAEQGAFDDVTAAEHADLFAAWEPQVSYWVGSIRRYGGALYRCVQAHTSQADWTPNAAASLWALIADPSEQWPVWGQPISAHDAYQIGDSVSHNGLNWVSTADNNVWEPGVYGWEPQPRAG